MGGLRNGVPSSEGFGVDLKERTVFPIPAMKCSRSGFLIMSDKKSVFCLGGASGPVPSHFEKYCEEKKEWVELAPLEPGFHPSYCVFDKYFICVFSRYDHKVFMKYVWS